VYDREYKREKSDGEGTRREKARIGWKERKEGAECAMGRERQSSICGMDVQRDGKKRGEILNEDRREIGWMTEIGKRRESIKRRGVGDRN
jgi:hypothetical protein